MTTAGIVMKKISLIFVLILINVISFMLFSFLIPGLAPLVAINKPVIEGGLDVSGVFFLIMIIMYWIYNIFLLVRKSAMKKNILPSIVLLLSPVMWLMIWGVLIYLAGPPCHSMHSSNIIISIDGSTNKIVHWGDRYHISTSDKNREQPK
jgi:hypothetical protein